MLISPWDVSPRPLTDAPYASPVPPRFGADLSAEGYYADARHSVVDAARQKAYLDATETARREAEAIVEAADAFQATGSRAAARLALDALGHAAEDRLLGGTMRGQQAEYVRGWLVGAMAVAYLKVRASGIPARTAAIRDWLAGVAASEETFLGKVRNNHRYWGGLGVMAEGIAGDRRDLFDWGVASARVGLGQVAADGTLPLEMARGAKALHYHLFAAAPLVETAALAQPNGVDLREGGALDRLVAACVRGVGSPEEFARRAGAAHEVERTDSMGWLIRYVEGWSVPLPTSLRNGPVASYLYLGGMPVVPSPKRNPGGPVP